MKKIILSAFISALICFAAASNSLAALGIVSLPATSVTTTSAVFNATISGTNSLNPTNVLYYGTVDYTNNAAMWAFSNVFGVAGTGNISTQITALLPNHKYFFRWVAEDGTSNIWTSATSNFWTKPSSPTTTPAVVTISLQTDTNAVLKAPTNFFGANSNAIIAAIGPQGDTNAVWGNISGTLANQLDLTDTVAKAASALQPGAAGTWTNLSEYNNDTGFVTASITNGLYSESNPSNYVTASVTNGLYSSANPSNYVDSSVTNGVNNRIDTLTNGAALGATALQPAVTNSWEVGVHLAWLTNYSETDPVWAAMSNAVVSNSTRGESAYTWGDHATNGYATGTPLYVESYQGTITGATIAAGASDSVTVSGPDMVITWNTNAAGGGGVGTITNMLGTDGSIVWTESGGPQPDGSVTAYVSGVVADYVPTNDPAYLAIETNLLAFHGGTNISLREDGTNIYWDSTLLEGVAAGTYYSGANGASVSGQVAALNTNTFPLQSGLGVSNRLAVLETNTFPLQSGLGVSNRLAVIETNYAPLPSFVAVSNTAAAALPASATNVFAATAIQVTGAAGIDMKGGPITNVDYVATTNSTVYVVKYVSQTTNTANVVITTCPFKPKGVTAVGISGTMVSWGSSDSAKNQENLVGVGGSYLSGPSGVCLDFYNGGPYQTYSLSTYNNDGATFTRVVSGSIITQATSVVFTFFR